MLMAWHVQRARVLPGRSPAALSLWLAAYGLVLWLSTTWARDTTLGDERVLAIAKAFVIYALVMLLASSRERVRQGAWTLVLAALVVGGLGLFQALAGTYDQTFGGLARVEHAHIYGEVFEPRIAGPVGDPNFFAQLLIPGVSPRRFAVGAAALAVLLLLLPSDFPRRLTTFRQFAPGSGGVLRLDSSFEQRRILATTAWRMFLDHPLTGVGAGNYTLLYRPYTEETGSVVLEHEEFDAPHYPHNLYLEVAAETGLPGLIAFAGALVTCFLYLRRARVRFRRALDKSSASLATAFQLALIGYLVSSLFLHGHFPRHLWLLFGFCGALYRLAPARAAEAS